MPPSASGRYRALRYRAFVAFESYGPKERSRDPASVDQGQIEATQILRSLRRIWALVEAMDRKSGRRFKTT
jgi:hypothetical protein